MLDFFAGNCLRVRTYFEDQPLDWGTAFFVENSSGDLFLATNWHIVTKRFPTTPSFSESGAVPELIKGGLHPKSTKGVHLDALFDVIFRLNTSDGNSPQWLEHPTLRHRADVVALPMSADQADNLRDVFQINPIHRFNELNTYSPRVMEGVFVIGYPFAITGGGNLPIYKGGTIASEPTRDQNRLPRFLVDARTGDGMSGSPVIFSRTGAWRREEGDEDKRPRRYAQEGSLGPGKTVGTIQVFAGVYSGRLRALDVNEEYTDLPTDIGIVWRREVLEEIIERGVPGTTLDEMIRLK